MKCIRLLLKLAWMVMLFGSLTTACRKDPGTPDDGNLRDGTPGQAIKSDTTSNRQFH